MDRLRVQVTIALVAVFCGAVAVDVIDCIAWGNRYEVPAALAGIVGTAVGGLYAPELLRRLKGGNGNGSNGESKT